MVQKSLSSIVINVQGLDNLDLTKPAVDAEFEEVDNDERQTV